MLKISRLKIGFTLVILFLLTLSVNAQKVTGTIKDKAVGETLVGATIVEKGTTNGVKTDFNGKFEINLDLSTPKTLVVTFLGYTTTEIAVSSTKRYVDIALSEAVSETKTVEITASRINEKILESPVTVERMNIAAIKETPAIGFYEGLANMKGVDMTTASLGFRVINTRGFNSTSPVRTLQIIDGVDNQSPGLNFALGNFVGSSELDVESVDIIVGANSATYGPNAFNGVISFTTKDPFKYRGLNVQIKSGNRNLIDRSFRYAGVYKEKVAIKINASYLTANDFEATNDAPIGSENITNGLQNGKNDSVGYDAINTYGETGSRQNGLLFKDADQNVDAPYDRVIVFRDGYKEKELVKNYNTSSLKLGGSVHYKFYKENQIVLGYNFGTGTTIYQGENRYSIRGIKFYQYKAQIKGDNYLIKAYRTKEDAGESYDLVFTGSKLLESAKSTAFWFNDYRDGYQQGRINGLSHREAYDFARNFANSAGGSDPNAKAKYIPGTPEFTEAFNKIVSTASYKATPDNRVGGTRFQDFSSLTHFEGQYNFKLNELIAKPLPERFLVGASYRIYNPISLGTIFSDTLTDKSDFNSAATVINVSEMGFYASSEKRILKERVNLISSVRFDKHQNFDLNISPAFSAVINTRGTDKLRVTASTAIRNPTLTDQYLDYNIGTIILQGNISGRNLVLLDDFRKYQTTNQVILTYLAPVKPERVISGEIGYKSVIAKKIYFDGSVYYSFYKNFIGNVIGLRDPRDNKPFQAYRVTSNARDIVSAYGSSIGLNYYFPKYFLINGNYTYSKLVKNDSEDPLIPNFNTPEHKYNLGFGARDLNKHIGFNVTFKFVQGFDYTGSPQFSGYVPSYGLVDAQVSYKYIAQNIIFKVGSSNILNNLHFEAYGAPNVARLIYASINWDINFKKDNN